MSNQRVLLGDSRLPRRLESEQVIRTTLSISTKLKLQSRVIHYLLCDDNRASSVITRALPNFKLLIRSA